MSKKEKGKFNIKEIFTNKQYRAIAILIFYAILFAFLIIGLNAPRDFIVDESGQQVSNLDGYKLIDGKNFNYKYTLMIDDEVYYYEGKKYDNKELVTVTKDGIREEYYFENKNIYIKRDNSYVLKENKPYMLFDFFNTDILDEIILRSIVEDEETHKYKVTNQEIHNVIGEGIKKLDNGYNYISLVYRNDNITGITFDFSNYARVTNEDYNTIIVTLNYSDFNLVDDFEIEVIE